MKAIVFRGFIKFVPSLKVFMKSVLALSVSLVFLGYGQTAEVAKPRPSFIQADVVGFLQWLIFEPEPAQNSQNKNKSQGYQPDSEKKLPLTDRVIEQARFLLENMPAVSKGSDKPKEVSPQDEWSGQTNPRRVVEPTETTSKPRFSKSPNKKPQSSAKENKSMFGSWFSGGKTLLANATTWAMEKVGASETRYSDEELNGNRRSNGKGIVEGRLLEDTGFSSQASSDSNNVINDGRKVKDPGAGPTFFVRAIDIQGNTVFSDGVLAPIVDVGEGLDMTLGVLNLYSQEIRAYYLSRGYFLAKAFVPKQEVKDGFVKIVVEEGKIGNIKVTGNETIPTKEILKRFKKVTKERVPNEKTLESALLELNSITGVQAKSLVKPGQVPGASDLEIIIKEPLPYTFALDGDNFGSEFTGRNRFGVTATAGNVLRLGDQLSLRGVDSDEDQKTFQASYSIPVNDSGGTAGFSYIYSEQTLGLDLAALNAGGETNIGSLELVQPLYRSRRGLIKARAGFDFRKFSNFIQNQTSSEDELVGGFLGISGDYKDEFQGHSYFDISVHRGFNETNENRALASRVLGEGDVTVGAYSFSRTQNAGFWDSYFVIKSLGQIASARALAPDLFYLGGFSSIRGYPLADQSGDQGIAGTLEYVLPIPGVVNFLGELYNLRNHISVFGFVDHGEAYVLNNQPGETDVSITGAGAGIRMTLPQDGSFPFLGINASYGVPVRGPNPSDGTNGIWYVNGFMAFRFDDA